MFAFSAAWIDHVLRCLCACLRQALARNIAFNNSARISQMNINWAAQRSYDSQRLCVTETIVQLRSTDTCPENPVGGNIRRRWENNSPCWGSDLVYNLDYKFLSSQRVVHQFPHILEKINIRQTEESPQPSRWPSIAGNLAESYVYPRKISINSCCPCIWCNPISASRLVCN